MSHRIDRSLGVKPYNNTPKTVAPKKGWSLKLTTVLKVMLGLCLISGAVHVLMSTNQCPQGVRCAD